MSYRRPFAQREIVKPYLDKLKENISFLDTYDDIEAEDEFGNTNRTKYVDFYEVMETIDDLLSGEEAMTREEAIKGLTSLVEVRRKYVVMQTMKDEIECLDMAIEALEQEPCEDCISRQAVDVLVDELARAISDERCCVSRGRSTATIMQDILDLPPVTPKPETVTDFADRCHECGAKYGKLLKQDSCGDAISRQAVLAIAGDSCLDLDSYEDTKDFCDEINELPPVTPKPKTGRWIEHFDESGKWYECDQCHTDWGGPVNYCPNCGANMEGDKR